MQFPKVKGAAVYAGIALVVIAAVLVLRLRTVAPTEGGDPASRGVSGASPHPDLATGRENVAVPDVSKPRPTPSEIKSRLHSLTRDQLLSVIDDQELFAKLDDALKTELVAKLASLDPHVVVQRTLDGKIPEKSFNGVRLNPAICTEHGDVVSKLLQELDLTAPRQKLVHGKLFMAGVEGAPALVVKSLLLRKQRDATYEIGSGFKVALRQLLVTDPAQAVSTVTANSQEGSAERASSLFIIGQGISSYPEGESPVSLDGISKKDLEAVDSGKAAALLRAGNASGLELLKGLPNEGLLNVISQQPSFAGLCKVDPQAAMGLISRIDMPAESKGAIETAAYTIVRKNKAVLADWLGQQPGSPKKAAVLSGAIRYLEETSSSDLDEWKQMLSDSN